MRGKERKGKERIPWPALERIEDERVTEERYRSMARKRTDGIDPLGWRLSKKWAFAIARVDEHFRAQGYHEGNCDTCVILQAREQAFREAFQDWDEVRLRNAPRKAGNGPRIDSPPQTPNPGPKRS